VVQNVGKLALAPLPVRPCGVHELGGDATFTARDTVCNYGVRSPVSAGAYPRARIGVILGGAFAARTHAGRALVGTGALLLVNAAEEYEYRHVDDGGDRSLVFDYHGSVLDEIGTGRARAFQSVCVPASAGSAGVVMLAHAALASGDVEALREAALAVAAVALAGVRAPGTGALPAAQARRVTQVLRHIEAHSHEDCSLEALAVRAGLSSFHFLRLCRALTGQTPRQLVIAARLRAAALALRTTRAPITRVAFDSGFGDLSHFHASFARAFGVSPRAYRLRRA
jgi:AraC family transcriptional regulator